jgi:hypothetical protein
MISIRKIIAGFFLFAYSITFSQHPHFLLYYSYLTQLSKAHDFLCSLGIKNYRYIPCNCDTKDGLMHADVAFFSDQRIIDCLQRMEQQASLTPLLQLSSSLYSYTPQQTPFIKELALLLFIIYKQILLEEYKKSPEMLKASTINSIVEMSEKINQLPIGEILNTIDMLAKELPPFLEKYEFNSPLSWKQWLKKYWWVPPVFGGWFALKILLSLQRPHYYLSPYLSSRPSVYLPHTETDDPVLQEIIIKNRPPNIV